MPIRYVNPSVLKNHPFSIELYGLEPDPEFVERVKAAGQIKEAIRLLPGTNTIVSGHRRRQAAIIAEIESVPVLEDEDLFNATETEIQLAIVNYNDQREKTTEQRAREFEVRTGIHTELAKERQGGRPTDEKPAQNVAQVSGRAADLAAKEVGFSRPTAQKASEVVKAIDKATEKGDVKRASVLREKLNNESVRSAHRELAEPKPEKPPMDEVGNILPKRLIQPFEARAEFASLLGKLKVILEGARNLAVRPGGEEFGINQFETEYANVRRRLTFAQPHAICPYCDGKATKPDGCKACKGLGWVGKASYNESPKAKELAREREAS